MKKQILPGTIILAVSLLLQFSTFCFHALGAPGDVDLSFDAGSGINDRVNAVAVQPDGKVLIAGQFTTVKGLERRGVARLHADGSGDSSFDAGPAILPDAAILAGGYYTHVYAVVPQPDGKVLVGQDLGITRLNADGSRDSSFNLYPVGGDYIRTTALALQADGKVLVGGYTVTETIDPEGYIEYFYNYFLTRVNANGSHDNSFADTNWGSSSWEYSWINSIVVQSDGRILYGGAFGIVRLHANGGGDSSFSSSAGGAVRSVALQPDGKVLIGGRFNRVDGVVRNGIARLHADGRLDGGFDPGTGTGGVESVVVQSDGRVLIGGEFTTVNGTSRNRIARLNPDGGVDSTFNPGTGADAGVYPIALQSDGKLFIGGDFKRVNGIVRNRIARLHADGSIDGSFQAGSADLPVYALALQPDGKALIGGDFSAVQDIDRRGIVRLNADGTVDLSFNQGAGIAGDYAVVTALLVQADGKVIIGGPFTSVHGETRTGVARLHADGSLDAGFNVNLTWDYPDYPPYVDSIAVGPDGKLLIGGAFNTVDGVVRNYLARLNSDGSLDSSFNSGTGVYNVSSVALQPDGKVLVGGSITVPGRNGITRLNPDGSQDSSFNGGAGVIVFGYVASVALQFDGKVLIGGAFPTVNGTNRTAIARVNADGSLDGSFTPDIGVNFADYPVVKSMVVQSDGKVLVGGGFSTVNGANRSGIVRLKADGSLDPELNSGSGADGSVNSIVVQPDGAVLIGGTFLTVNGAMRPGVARLHGDTAPPLSLALSNGSVVLSWRASGLSLQLEESTDLSLPDSWSPVAESAVVNGNQFDVTVPATAPRKFFRLKPR